VKTGKDQGEWKGMSECFVMKSCSGYEMLLFVIRNWLNATF